MMVCKQVIYTGRVQGVGFRYTAQSLARGLPVSGHVRNRSDGSVELVVEGDAAAVDDLLRRLAQEMAGCIDLAETKEQVLHGYRGFSIRH